MKKLLCVLVFYFSSTVMSFVGSTEADYENVTNQPTDTGRGVVMEFEHDQTESQNNKKTGVEKEQSEGVEFIIGGQSVDGIAKRGKLKKIK